MSKPTGFKITTIHAFVATEPDGTEGVVAYNTPSQGWVPLVCADEARIASCRRMAEEIGRVTGRRIVLVKFSVREDIEVISA